MSLLDTASLIVTPNGYKEGKLYSVIPSDGSGDMSVTRATTATRVNSAGLVELVPYNLLRWSEDLTQWTANAQIATTQLVFNPLTGKNNATKITKVTSAGDPWVVQTNAAGDGTYTYSFYLWTDAGQPTDVTLFLYNSAVSEVYTLAITLTTTPTRYEYTSTFASTGGAINARVDLSATATNQYIYAYAGQLVEGSVAKDYQKTETRLNIPRLDYSNGTCPSLLVEPQRTNLVFWSNNFSPSKAYNYQNASQSSSTITAPDGLTTTGITSTTSANDFHRFFKSVDASSATYTSSIYAKKGNSRYLGLGVNHNGSATKENIVVFDLQNGVIASNPYGVTATIEDANNGWYRLTHTFTYTGATSVDICVHNAGTGAFTTLNFQVFDSPTAPTTLYIYGLQFELGSYATSYIPTTSASVTRNADVISKTGISSLIGQTEGTIFLDFYVDNISSQTNDPIILSLGVDQYIQIYDDGRIQFYFESGCNIDLTGFGLANGRHKFGFGYKANDFVAYVDGTLAGTDTSGTPNGTSLLNLGYSNTNFIGKIDYNAVALWKTRLTNTQLAQLTTI